MAYNESQSPQGKSGAFFLIILGALIFVTVPTYLTDSPTLGIAAIVFGFVVGGIGFYRYYRQRQKGGRVAP